MLNFSSTISEKTILQNANTLTSINLAQSKYLPHLRIDDQGLIQFESILPVALSQANGQSPKAASQNEGQQEKLILIWHLTLFMEQCRNKMIQLKTKPMTTLTEYYTSANEIKGLIFLLTKHIALIENITKRIHVFEIRSRQTNDLLTRLTNQKLDCQLNNTLNKAQELIVEFKATLKLKLVQIKHSIQIHSNLLIDTRATLSPREFALCPSINVKAIINTTLYKYDFDFTDIYSFELMSSAYNVQNIFVTFNCLPNMTPSKCTVEEFLSSDYRPSKVVRKFIDSQRYIVGYHPTNLAVCIPAPIDLVNSNLTHFLFKTLVEIADNDGYVGIDLYTPYEMSELVYALGFVPTDEKQPDAKTLNEKVELYASFNFFPIINMYAMLDSIQSQMQLRHFRFDMADLGTQPIYLAEGKKTTWCQMIQANRSLEQNLRKEILPVPLNFPTKRTYIPSFSEIQKAQLGLPLKSRSIFCSPGEEVNFLDMQSDSALKEVGESEKFVSDAQSANPKYNRIRANNKK